MSNSKNKPSLISHNINPSTLASCIQKIKKRIKQQGDKPYATVEYQFELLKQLSEFDFGRFLLQNQGLNGYWTNYMLTYPMLSKKLKRNNRGDTLGHMETFLLTKAPAVLATQERFQIFLKENQKQVKDNKKLASIPCGMMGELLYLNYSDIKAIQLVGIDYDAKALKDAKILSEKRELSHYVHLVQCDVWELDIKNEFDLISSNGLTIYEPDDRKILLLYKQFHQALKPKGKLVISFLTFPPAFTDQCEWDMDKINKEDLLLQKIIFSDIIEAKFQCYRSTEQTKAQLRMAGFNDIEIKYDKAKIFPTAIAYEK